MTTPSAGSPLPLKQGEEPEEPIDAVIGLLEGLFIDYSTGSVETNHGNQPGGTIVAALAHAKEARRALKAFGDRRGEEERAKAWADARKVLTEHDANALADVERLMDRVAALEKQLSDAMEILSCAKGGLRTASDDDWQWNAQCGIVLAAIDECEARMRTLAAAPSGDAKGRGQ